MGGPEFAIAIIAVLLLLVMCSVPVVLALGLCSFFGLAYLTGSLEIAGSLLANTTYEAIRDYVFAVIPLFVLMGEFISRSGAASDLYNLVNRGFKRLPGRLALATVGGNAVFGAVTGVSIASAAAFSRIAYPQMLRHNYDKSVALGSIAGSASLGMLIPPSVLLIVWGVISEQSIGRLFVAGVLPGILLATMFFVFIIGFAILRPSAFGGAHANTAIAEDENGESRLNEVFGGLGVALLIFAVLGGIWLGAFTPTEAAGIGALLALVLAVLKGVPLTGLKEAVLETGRISAPLLFLLITAQMYSRLLALGGIVDFIQTLFLSVGDSPLTILLIMVAVWFVLGMFIDSVSIILLTVPIFAPLALSAGYDPIAFAIIGIVAIEAGLLTPPLGLCVYTVKGCVNDPDATLGRIFQGSIPYWIILLILVFLVAAFPALATWLPSLMQ
ncbi:TRAP dicarboxylate transporter, DctM subunit [Candidatus Filomicrobium marinum]|uniref:TRAP transporter large permease protein n=2 Tax=Filomicrobium TaxID=119044 RepID=A0A0D6JEW3_9HYPH|nr:MULTISPECIES: TRAP transporter large permease [Filomicrobium]CFX21050.1 TRAP dicarboxylate transporter, DctM subunit [Candidatus Filomicrobium marinum]CPR18725.1 TRAP dicarboxylate transporter, DctM subunit [Candidatus Filomicrobium marinum]SDO15101.1 TRAP transporter, DctM subunit [Filomicrobium insigne]